VALDLRTLPRELVEEHYAEHEGKPFFEPLVAFMTSGPVVAMIIEGHRCVEAFRTLAGATDPVKAAPGTIRGDLATDIGTTVVQNLVHGSDSPISAEREIKLFFPGFV
jgi:nucleoside-diphosphate kinase